LTSLEVLSYLTKIEGNYYVVSQLVTYPEIGFIIGMGKTIAEAIEEVGRSGFTDN